MRRAEIWTVSGGADYAGKPRPAVIVLDDHFDMDSVTICPFTTDPTEAPLFRLAVEPEPGNGLDTRSRIRNSILARSAQSIASRSGVRSVYGP